MRRDIAAAGATLAASVLIVSLAPRTEAATPQVGAANAALRYLYAQVGADGSIAGNAGATEDTVISAADSGYDPARIVAISGKNAYDFLASKAASINTAGAAAKYVLAWVAAGKPAAIDASAQLTKLNTLSTSGGYLTSKGTFRNAAASEAANAYSQSLAVLADLAAGHSLPAHATAWLACAQRSGGGFGYLINDATPTPPSSCGDASSDSNDTAIILQALGRAGVTSAGSAAITYLHSVQQSDGGFGFTSGSGSDPNSDATVIQALLAIGEDPTGSSWTVGGHTPISNLESFADPHGSGGYVFPGNTAPDAFTTSAIPQALALKPLGSPTTVVKGATPPAATPVPTPSPTSSPVTPGVPSTGGRPWAPSGPPGLVLVAAGALLLAAARWCAPRRTDVL